MEYIIVHSVEGSKKLVDEVNKKIAEGWEPLGGVSGTILDFSEHNMPNGNALFQAMIKRS